MSQSTLEVLLSSWLEGHPRMSTGGRSNRRGHWWKQAWVSLTRDASVEARTPRTTLMLTSLPVRIVSLSFAFASSAVYRIQDRQHDAWQQGTQQSGTVRSDRVSW